MSTVILGTAKNFNEELSIDQADYIGVKIEGPYKHKYYRY